MDACRSGSAACGLFSISADATADVEIATHFMVETKLDASTIPPGLIIKPRVETAELRLLDFELHRISKADGPIVEELGDGLKRAVRRELAEERENRATDQSAVGKKRRRPALVSPGIDQEQVAGH